MSFEGRLRSYFKRSRTSLAVLGLCSYSTSPGLIFSRFQINVAKQIRNPCHIFVSRGVFSLTGHICMDRISTRFCVGNIPDTFVYTFCVYTFCLYILCLFIHSVDTNICYVNLRRTCYVDSM